ncbi:hypothetical protein [Paraburkholderia adhaesiva]|uniref:hypothetical protein n=1 Tax=Paraburkholderia adhaesiva TaxID=2883244 RepID=UPI001F3A2619|nr:hypothetical protein [Paraburkholderia adhaesiva]
MDFVPRWVDKIAFLYVALFAYGYHIEKTQMKWMDRREHLSFRIELKCSDLDLIPGSSVDFGIIGKLGERSVRYAELSTGQLEKATSWRKVLDETKRPYKYVTSLGTLTANDPEW